MKALLSKTLNYKIKMVGGILVKAPWILREKNIDLLLIGEDRKEYKLISSKKTVRMWNLLDSRVQITGFAKHDPSMENKLLVLTYKCIDDFMDTDGLPINLMDEYEFEPNRLDYAI